MVLCVGLALLALAFVAPAAADPGVSVSADGDAVDVMADSDNGSVACTFATDAEENQEPCEAEGPFEMPEDGDDGDDGAEFDPSVDAEVGPDGAEAEVNGADGELACTFTAPGEDEEPEAPCEGTVPGQEELPGDGDDGGEDDGGSTNLVFEGAVGEDGLYLTVGDGENGVACVLGPDYEGEEPPCKQLGNEDDDGEEAPEPPAETPTAELPADELPADELPTCEVLTENALLEYAAS